MHQAVQDRRGCKLAGKQLVPSAHWQVGRDNEGVLFIPLSDHLESQESETAKLEGYAHGDLPGLRKVLSGIPRTETQTEVLQPCLCQQGQDGGEETT